MLKRFYADNFRCLTNFELKLDEANVLLGANGTGKTSVLSVLQKIQARGTWATHRGSILGARSVLAPKR